MQSGIVVVLESLSSAEEVVGALRDIRAHTAPSGATCRLRFRASLLQMSFRLATTARARRLPRFVSRAPRRNSRHCSLSAGKTTLVDLLLEHLRQLAGALCWTRRRADYFGGSVAPPRYICSSRSVSTKRYAWRISVSTILQSRMRIFSRACERRI